MKTKLLKKIRKRFSVNYYPNSEDYRGKYYLKDKADVNYYTYSFIKGVYWNETKQDCLNTMIELVSFEYYKYSRKYKLSKIHTKVWHDAKTQTP